MGKISLPVPSGPPPGSVEVAVSLLVHRAWPLRPRPAGVVLEVLGRAGSPPASRVVVADRYGMSVTRVAQCLSRAATLARAVGAPDSLRAAVALLAAGPVRTAAQATLTLYEVGLVHEALHPRTVLAAARLFALPVSFDAPRLPGGSFLVVPHADTGAVDAFTRAVRAAVGRDGIVALDPVAARHGLDAETAAVIATTTPGWRLRDGQVWAVPDRSRAGLRRAVDRILATGPHTLDQLAAALPRALRLRAGASTSLEPRLLEAYLRSQPDLHLAGRTVTAQSPAPVVGSDRALLAAFAGMERRELSAAQLRAALRCAGYGPSGLDSLIAACPVIVRARPGEYRPLRHHRASSGTLRSGRDKSPPAPRTP